MRKARLTRTEEIPRVVGAGLLSGVGLFTLLGLTAGCQPTSNEGSSVWLRDELQRHQRIVSDALEAHRKTDLPLHEFTHDWNRELQEARARIEATHGDERREALYAYLNLGSGAYGADLEPNVVDLVLQEVPPDSYLWSIEPFLLETAAFQGESRSVVSAYMARVITEHPDPEVRRVAATRADPARQLAPGKAMPHFSFASLDDPGATYSEASLKGKAYLLDFWATWCAPCIAEMSGLHAALDDFGSRGLQILSISLDDPETVETFRREHWEMPWLHAVVAEGLKSPSLEPFEISGLPMPILVDEQGIVVAVGQPLRGPRLHRTLARVLGAGRSP